MREITVCFEDQSQVQQLASLAAQYPNRMELVSGRCRVSARSVVGILSLGLGRRLQLRVYGDEVSEELLRQLEPFRCREEA